MSFGQKRGGWAHKHEPQEISMFFVWEVLPDYEVDQLFFDLFRHLAEPNDEGQSALFSMIKPLGLSSALEYLSSSIRPLGQVA